MFHVVAWIRKTTAVACCLFVMFVVAGYAAAESAETGRLVEIATKSSGEKQFQAIDSLGQQHESASQVVPQLTKLLHHDDDQVQWRSARALGDYGALAQSAAGDLRTMISEGDPVVKYHAAIALGKLGDRSDESIQALVSAATSDDARVARAAIAAIRHLRPGPEKVAEVLSTALASDDQAVALHALQAIVDLGAEATPLLKKALHQPKTTFLACTAVEHIGPGAAGTVSELTELLSTTKHSHLLIQALLALASIGPAAESASPQIKPWLESTTDATVPVAAAFALGSIGAKDADAELRAALEKADPLLQMTAAWSLAKLHPDDPVAEKLAIEKFAQGLKSDDPAIRMAAAKNLQSLEAPPELIAPALVALLNDPHPEVQTNAIEAIASLGESVVPRAIRALQSPELRDAAIRVITRIGPKASNAVQPLVEAAGSADADTRTHIQLALAAIGPNAAPATDMLVKSIGSDDAGERESALLALRKIGPGASNAIRPLLQRMRADDSFDALAAAWALARIAPENAQVSAAVVERLSLALANNNSDEQVRLESVAALAHLGAAASSATDPLRRVAKEDSSASVRAAAEAAIAEIAPGS